jgi:glutamate N-acetyltransferase/amino-acid N-acetyltransferase
LCKQLHASIAPHPRGWFFSRGKPGGTEEGEQMSEVTGIEGGITAPEGFKAAGIHAGIKAKRPDMALIVPETPAAVAGTFTTNAVPAAPVRLCRARLAGKLARAVVINSGNANAWTGPAGMADAEKMASLTAAALDIDEKQVFVCSTGCIGVPLPMKAVEAGIPAAVRALSSDGGAFAAEAIMTTDTAPKQAAVECTVGGRVIRVGGMAKGAGMIEPHMATMLAFLTTDAAVDAGALQSALSTAVDRSFNRISVDGDQSTNDTVLILANGAAGNKLLREEDPDWPLFVTAVKKVAFNLAMQIVADGEGATRFVTVKVGTAASDTEAGLAARAIANSLLVKTSWYGGDPNWGRIVDALGYSGAEVQEERVEISYEDVCAVRGGVSCPDVSTEALAEVLARDRFRINIDLHIGAGECTLYTCDCSEEYVRINSAYMT